MLDGTISALDANKQKHVFQSVIQEHCKDKTRIIATNSADFLKMADRVAVLENGRITAFGPLAEI